MFGHLAAGGQAGGRARLRAGEVQGDHRGAGADLRRDVWILEAMWKLVQFLSHESQLSNIKYFMKSANG